MKDKKRYLNSYLLQGNIIRTLNEMILENPSQKDLYIKKIKNCEKIRKNIEKDISNMPDERLKIILFEKYICGHTLEEVSIILNYSKRHIERLHITALKQFKGQKT